MQHEMNGKSKMGCEHSDFLCEPKALAGLDLAKTTHLCVDLQEYYFHSSSYIEFHNLYEEADRVADRIAHIAPLFNEAGMNKTFWIYHTVLKDGKGDFYKVNPPQEDRLAKSAYSPFNAESCMDERLKRRGIDTIILTGGYTDYCVADTAQDALRKGYKVIVLSDCIMNFSPITKGALKGYFTIWAGQDQRQATFVTSDCLLEHIARNQTPAKIPSPS